MKTEELKPFLNKYVKLVKIDGFYIFGYIRTINEESILFETEQATSLLNISGIREILIKKEDM